jgi:hypothetical protein
VSLTGKGTQLRHLELTGDERRRFETDGYLAVDSVAAESEIAWLRQRYDRLLSGPRSGFLDGVFDLSRPYGTTDDPQLGQLLLPERRIEGLADTPAFQNARHLAARLLDVDDDALEMWTHLIFKAPHSRAVTPWHQDEAYWDVHLTYRSVAAWLPLDDVDETNGCLWYLPGSQSGEVLRHRHLGGNPDVHVLEIDEDADTTDARPVPLRAGGLVLHHPRTLHFAGTNATDHIRRAWGIVFQTPPQKRDKPAHRPWWQEGHAAHAAAFARRSGLKTSR